MLAVTAKRFKATGTGKLRRRRAFRNHILEKKPSTRTRRLKDEVTLVSGDEARIKRMLGK